MASVILLKNTESEYPTCQLENRRSIRLDFEQEEMLTMKAGPRRREPDADCRTPVDLAAANDGGDRRIHTLRKHGRSFKVIR